MSLDQLRERLKRSADFNQSGRDAWMTIKAHSVRPGSCVLDIGAGTGRYRQLFLHCRYHAQDLAAYSGTREGTQAEQWVYTPLDFVSNASHLPLRDGIYDAIVCTEVLEHVPEPITVIREIGRVLRPGGRLFLAAPLGSGLHQQPYHYYGGYTPYFYQRFLPEAGLRVISIEPNGGFFRHLGQEIARAGYILSYRRGRPWWHPARLLATAVTGIIVQWLLARLDDEVFVGEFTVGYHVEAVRLESGALLTAL